MIILNIKLLINIKLILIEILSIKSDDNNELPIFLFTVYMIYNFPFFYL